jgi:hypothetical protein
MQKQSISDKLRELKEAAWKVSWKNPESRQFAKKYADKTSELIREGVKAAGQEAEETEQMAVAFFKLLEAKLDLSGRKEPPTREEVKEAIDQLKDVGRFTVFTALVIIPGGVISMVGLELLARRFGVRGFNLIPSSFRKMKKEQARQEQEGDAPAIPLPPPSRDSTFTPE